MKEILEKINQLSSDAYLIAGDLLQKSFSSKENYKELSNASKTLQDISILTINMWSELKEKFNQNSESYKSEDSKKSNEQEFNQGIEELKDHIHTLAWKNRKETFYCGECIETIHKLLGILTMLTGNENKDFVKEIHDIIGE